MTSMIPQVKSMSATLNIGNRSPIKIKSLTHEKNILSIVLPSEPAINNSASQYLSIYALYKYRKSHIAKKPIHIESICGNGRDREIPGFKKGSTKKKSEKNPRSKNTYLLHWSITTNIIMVRMREIYLFIVISTR